MDINRIVAINVYYLAKKKDMKIGDIENKLGVSTGYISRMKNSGNNIPLKTAYELARILGITMNDLCSNLRLKEMENMAKELGYRLVPIEEEPLPENTPEDGSK